MKIVTPNDENCYKEPRRKSGSGWLSTHVNLGKVLMNFEPLGALDVVVSCSPQPEGEVTGARAEEVVSVTGRSPQGLEWWPARHMLVIVESGALVEDVCPPSSGLQVLLGSKRLLSQVGFWVSVH